MTVFSENLKYMTVVGDERVQGGKIKFGRGVNEFKEDREYVWEFCIKRLTISIVKEITKDQPIEYPLVLLRPEDIKCPICWDELSGNVVACEAKHQTCLKCYNLLPTPTGGIKKCTLCNVPRYSNDEREKVKKMNGAETEAEPYLYFDVESDRNSRMDFAYNEALFLSMLKIEGLKHGFDPFRRMLISSFYNYCTDDKRFVSDYEFNTLNQKDGNNRYLKLESSIALQEDLPQAFQDYIAAIKDPQEYPKIFQDVATTEITTPSYTDSEFYRDLREIDGNLERIVTYADYKPILMREIYFRKHILKALRQDDLQGFFKNILKRIVDFAADRGTNGTMFLISRKIMN